MDSTYKAGGEHPSYAKAFWTHAIFGMGMYYVDPQLRRKWLYPLLVLLISTLILCMILYKLTWAMQIGFFEIKEMWKGQVSNALGSMLWPLLVLYAFSFVDVMVACYMRRKNYHSKKAQWWIKVTKEFSKTPSESEIGNKV